MVLAALAMLGIIGYLTLGPQGTTPYCLDTGTPTLLWTGTVAGASTIYWTVAPRPNMSDRNLTLQAIGVGASVPTTCTANVEQSNDGGVTWQPVGTAGTAIALVAAAVGTAYRLLNIGPGPQYRINVTTLTLGNATSVNIIGSLA